MFIDEIYLSFQLTFSIVFLSAYLDRRLDGLVDSPHLGTVFPFGPDTDESLSVDAEAPPSSNPTSK